MKTTLLVMTLNEVDGMKAIMPRVDRSWLDQIIVVDGGSTDGTIEWAKENGYAVYVQKQKGLRHAYTEVWPQVIGDVVITFSPDGNSVPELIRKLIPKMEEGYDMVIASRYLDDAKTEDDDFLTGFGNWLFTRTVNLLHGRNYTDVMVIYRAYRKAMVYELELDRADAYALPEKLFGTKISWEPLLSVRAAKAKLKVAEIPGDEPPRIGGVTCPRQSPPAIIEKLPRGKELRNEEGQAYGRADHWRAQAGGGRPNGEGSGAGTGRQRGDDLHLEEQVRRHGGQ